ncbi:HU family DNA-binding protein [Aliidiomarina quisquiliarum]|uniref:HU family DNA-binding protein n=1 Tax=Aliidiomarina quisquiliarum TaxID=2938947 RepID=UPI00208E3838|nr:HU family DNA-binding protein [Aliidiomarina quisquiliarum]MCO4320352.1 HU family DNA-binding protein [Aliidiomarina quisquiliarum]
MNKSELIDAIAQSTGLSKADSGRALNAVTEKITESLAKGEEVALVGFGTFKTSHRAERQGRNPANGQTITIAAAKVAQWKPSKVVKEALNK